MKKILALILSLTMIFALCACTGAATPAATEEPTPAPTEEPTPAVTDSTADDAQSRRDAQSEALVGLLSDFETKIQSGSAGSSLKAVAQAARLMDWATTDGADMPKEDITGTAEGFMQPMSEDEKSLFLMQIQALDNAYQQLQMPGQEELLESAGVTDCGYPWDSAPNEVVETLLRALGQRPPEGYVAPEQPVADISLYNSVLQAYYTSIAERRDVTTLPAQMNLNIPGFYASGDLSALGYCYYDINSDGTDELLIGPCSADYPAYEIFDIYTIVSGEVVTVAQGWERNFYAVCPDGTVANNSSGGAGDWSYVFSTLASNGVLSANYSLICSAAVNADSPFFSATGGSSDSDPSTWQSIPSADFWAQCDSYEASFVSPGYTPFTNF